MMIWSDDDIIFDPYIATVLCTLYIILFIAGLSGNLCLVFAVISRKSVRRSSLHCLLANAATVNCLLCLTSIPATILPPYLDGWYFGWLACHLSMLLPSVAVFNLALTVVLVAVERYYAVKHPDKEYAVLSSSYIFGTIVLVWIASSLVALPYAMRAKFELSRSGTPQCWMEIPGNIGNIFWTCAFFFTSSMPLLIGFVIYGALLSSSSRAKMTETIEHGHLSNDAAYESRKCLLAIKVSMMLGVCWLPYNSVCRLTDFTGNSLGRLEALADLTGLFIALSSVIWLPIICFREDDLLREVGKDVTKNRMWTVEDNTVELVMAKDDLIEWL